MKGVQISNPKHYANTTTLGDGSFTVLRHNCLPIPIFSPGFSLPNVVMASPALWIYKCGMEIIRNMKVHFNWVLLGLILHPKGLLGKEVIHPISSITGFHSLHWLPLCFRKMRLKQIYGPSFKLNFPLKKAGVLSLWGMEVRDISELEPNAPDDWQYAQDFQQLYNRQYMGAVGLNSRKILGGTAYLNASLSGAGNGIKWDLN